MTAGTTAAKVAAVLRECFARFGLPKQLVSDGGPPFTSVEFERFLRCNAIQHVLAAPYHPSSNGAAENAVKTVKKAIKKAILEGDNVDRALSKFLFQYRNTEHASTKRAPAAAMLGRRLRSRLDMLRPQTAYFVEAAQESQVRNAGGILRDLKEVDEVLVKKLRPNSTVKWKPGIIETRTGAVTYKVRTEDVTKTRHIDQIMPMRKTNRLSLARSVQSSTNDADEPELATDPAPTGRTTEAAFLDAEESPCPSTATSPSTPLPPTFRQVDDEGASASPTAGYLRPRNKRPNYRM